MMSAHLQQPNGGGATSISIGGVAHPDEQQHLPQATEQSSPLVNRAAESLSPFVRAHASDPIAWQPLNEATIALAKSTNKLIFLHIGFAACHYCHLTAQDSFSHPAVAALLNEAFVPVLLDREERPDLDAIYMNYIQAVNGAGGWPLNLFLTPELAPIYGGTYLPGPGTEHSGEGLLDGLGHGQRQHGATNGGGSENGDADGERLDFLVVLRKLKNVWVEQEARCRKEAQDIILQLREFAAEGTLGTRSLGTTTGIGASSAAVPTDATGSTDPLSAAGAFRRSSAVEMDLDLDQLEEAYAHIRGTFDAVNGGFGLAPKFPTPAKLSFLLRLAHFPQAVLDVVGEKEVEQATHMALHTLRRIRDSGLRDHVGAGFSRYSGTADWTLPHFEKMVADNALLLGVYLDAWLGQGKGKDLAKSDEFADVVFELADYLSSSPIALESGGFVTSEAADSFYRRGDRHMREGAYYLWTRREFDTVVGGGQNTSGGGDGQHYASLVAAAYWNVREDGNVKRDQDPFDEFINQNVLVAAKDAAELSRQFGIPAEEVRRLVAGAREKLAAHREKERVRPAADEKVVVAINSMVISALVRTAAAVKGVDAEKSTRYLQRARKGLEFIEAQLWDDSTKTLYRIWNEKRGETQAFADDYAFLIEALLDYVEVTQDLHWLEWADTLQQIQIKLFYDSPDSGAPVTPLAHRSSSGGFYTTTEDAPFDILRLKDGMDTAQPSSNAVSALNLFRLGYLLADESYLAAARETINAFEVEILQYPWLFVGLLSAIVTARLGGDSIVLVGDYNSEWPDHPLKWQREPKTQTRVSLRLEILSQDKPADTGAPAPAPTSSGGEETQDVPQVVPPPPSEDDGSSSGAKAALGRTWLLHRNTILANELDKKEWPHSGALKFGEAKFEYDVAAAS